MNYLIVNQDNKFYEDRIYNGLYLDKRLINNTTYILIPFSIKYWFVTINLNKTLEYKLKPEICERFLKLKK